MRRNWTSLFSLLLHVFFFHVNCSEEITFLEHGAFVELDAYASSSLSASASDLASSGISFEFSFMTDSTTAILLYATTREPAANVPLDPESIAAIQRLQRLFIAAEVINGKTVLSMNDGSGVVTLESEVIVDNGVWHRVTAIFSPTRLEIVVDGIPKSLIPSTDSSQSGRTSSIQQIDFSSIFLGGIHPNREFNALQQRLHSILSEGSAHHSSLLGCMREIKLNRKAIGIREAKDVSHISTTGGCAWKFICRLMDPCIDDAECWQEGLDGFFCACEHDLCTRSNFNASSEHRPDSTLNVPESTSGGRDSDRSSGRRAQVSGQEDGILVEPQPNYRQRNHHRQRNATGTPGPSPVSSSSSSSSTSSTSSRLSSTPSPSVLSLLPNDGLSLAASAAAAGNSPKVLSFPVNQDLGSARKAQGDVDVGRRHETNLLPETATGGRPAAAPASFISYLETVVSKEQAITCFIVAVVCLIGLMLVAMVRGFYLYGRHKENRRQSHKDPNLHNAGYSMSLSGTSAGGRKDSDTTASACTPLPLASEYDDLLSPPSISSRLGVDVSDATHSSSLMMMAPPSGPPSLSNYTGSMDSHQPILAPHVPMSQQSLYARIDKKNQQPERRHRMLLMQQQQQNNCRESSLILPLPPPSLFFNSAVNEATESLIGSDSSSPSGAGTATTTTTAGATTSSSSTSSSPTTGGLHHLMHTSLNPRSHHHAHHLSDCLPEVVETHDVHDKSLDERMTRRRDSGSDSVRCLVYSHPPPPPDLSLFSPFNPYTSSTTGRPNPSHATSAAESAGQSLFAPESGFSTLGRRAGKNALSRMKSGPATNDFCLQDLHPDGGSGRQKEPAFPGLRTGSRIVDICRHHDRRHESIIDINVQKVPHPSANTDESTRTFYSFN